MCTIMTLSRDLYSRKVQARIRQDAMSNPDGFALLLSDSYGASTLLRTMDIETVMGLLHTVPWERMFLHCRYATGGRVDLDNCHGWANEGVFYMHNGVLRDEKAWRHTVDSKLIGDWLDLGVDYALEKLLGESYANVFLIDTPEGYYSVHRSTVGTLYTDWRGNYSTNRVGRIRSPVPMGAQNSWWLPGCDQVDTVETLLNEGRI